MTLVSSLLSFLIMHVHSKKRDLIINDLNEMFFIKALKPSLNTQEDSIQAKLLTPRPHEDDCKRKR